MGPPIAESEDDGLDEHADGDDDDEVESDEEEHNDEDTDPSDDDDKDESPTERPRTRASTEQGRAAPPASAARESPTKAKPLQSDNESDVSSDPSTSEEDEESDPSASDDDEESELPSRRPITRSTTNRVSSAASAKTPSKSSAASAKTPSKSPAKATRRQELESDSSASSARPNGWDVKARKRLSATLGPGEYQCQLVDYKRLPSKALMYQIKWLKPKPGESPLQWVQEKDLIGGGWGPAMKMIDRWKAWAARQTGANKNLSDYLRSTEAQKVAKRGSKHADDGTEKGQCGYDAVGIVVEEFGYGHVVNQERIDQFKAAGALRRRLDPKNIYGITKNALVAFVHSLKLNIKVSKNLWHGNGVGVEGLKALNLPDGWYLIAGKNRDEMNPKGHVFVAEIAGNSEVVYIHEKEGLEDAKWLAEWLYDIQWVLRVDKG
jgi:hypothetical protein